MPHLSMIFWGKVTWSVIIHNNDAFMNILFLQDEIIAACCGIALFLSHSFLLCLINVGFSLFLSEFSLLCI